MSTGFRDTDDSSIEEDRRRQISNSASLNHPQWDLTNLRPFKIKIISPSAINRESYYYCSAVTHHSKAGR